MAAGGWTGEAREADDHVRGFVSAIKSDVESRTGASYSKFNPTLVKSQVVAGTNYKVKVEVDDGNYIHVTFFQPLPHTGAAAEVKDVETGKSAGDAL